MIDPQDLVNGMGWDEWLMLMAWGASLKSKDPSTKVGCIIVDDQHRPMSWGYNGFARGVRDTFERLNNKSLKYPLMIHAEKNACFSCPQTREKKIAYVTHRPCTPCAGALIQTGVVRVVWDRLVDGWDDDGTIILREAGVPVVQKPCHLLAARFHK